MNSLQTLVLPDWTPLTLGLGLMAFVLGGVVKGTLGVGLPLVVVPLLSLVLPTHFAIALMAIPVLSSNVWQLIDSEAPLQHARRFAPLLVSLVVTTVITVPLTLALSAQGLNIMLAVAVFTAVFLMAFTPQLDISEKHEKLASWAVGTLSGIMGGISSLTGPIIITYLMALRLPRERFVGTISVIYLAASVPLYLAMAWVGRFGWTEMLLSAVAMVPVFIGMALGKRIRHHLSETWFRRVLLVFLGLIGLALILK